MDSPPVFPKKQVIALAIAFLICLLLVIFNGCKKTTFDHPPQHDAAFTEQFFTTHSTNKDVLHVIDLLKAANERTGFVSRLPQNCGLPIWDKIVLRQHTIATFAAPAKDDADIIVPLTSNDENLSSVIIAKPTAEGYTIYCSTTNDQLYKTVHAADVNTTDGTNDLVAFFYMENRAFGTTTFYHIPAAFFPEITQLDDKGEKTITIKTAAPETSGLMEEPCIIVICTTCPGGVTSYCVDEPNGDPGGGGGGGSTGGGGTTGGGNTGGGTGTFPQWPTSPPPGGAGGNGSGGGTPTGGGNTCPFAGGWYNFMPLPDPCLPPPAPPSDTITTNQILTLLHDENVRIKKTRDSVWNVARSNNWEYKFLVGQKNGTTSIIIESIKTDYAPDYVSPKYSTSFPGYVIIGDYHTHQDPLPKDRHPNDPNDISESNFTHDNKKKPLYRSYVDCGDTLYVIVNENKLQMESFNRTHNFFDAHYNVWTPILRSSSNRRKEGLALLISFLGSASSCGVGIYKSINVDRTIFQKVN